MVWRSSNRRVWWTGNIQRLSSLRVFFLVAAVCRTRVLGSCGSLDELLEQTIVDIRPSPFCTVNRSSSSNSIPSQLLMKVSPSCKLARVRELPTSLTATLTFNGTLSQLLSELHAVESCRRPVPKMGKCRGEAKPARYEKRRRQ